MSEIPMPRQDVPESGVKSLLSAQISDDHLPYGPPPADFLEEEVASDETAPDITDALTTSEIDVLLKNAKATLERSGAEAALCLQEAGRLLQKRAKRMADAWRCYSMALMADPNSKRSLAALRRLAAQSGMHDVKRRIIEDSLPLAADSVERSALWAARGVMDLTQGKTDDAMNSLGHAETADDTFLAPSLLKAHLCDAREDGDELCRVLTRIGGGQFESDLRGAAELMTALVEEKLGRIDDAVNRLADGVEKDLEFSAAGHWSRLRLSMRLKRDEAVVRASQSLLEKQAGEVDQAPVRRIQAAVRARLAHEDGAGPLLEGIGGDALDGAVRLEQVLADHRDGKEPEDFLDNFNVSLPAAAAAASYLNLAEPSSGDATSSPLRDMDAGARIDFLSFSEDWHGLREVYSELREKCTDEKDRWALAIGEAFIGIEYLKRPDEALAMLREETDRINRIPLPALIRAYDSEAAHLAELAIAEAEDGSFDEFKAWRFAWAAHHMEPSDPDEAARMYHRALDLMPSMMFSLSGLGRTHSDRTVLAKAFLSASEAAVHSEDKLHSLLRAAILNLANQKTADAAALFGDAYDLAPDDPELGIIVSRLARTYPEIARPAFVEPKDDSETNYSAIQCLALGYLALDINPEHATHWMEKAVAMTRDEPLARFGQYLAQVRMGAWGELEAALGKSLESAESSDQKGLYLRQLFDLQHRLKSDRARVCETLEGLVDLDPQQLTPSVWLLCEGLFDWRPEAIASHLLTISQNTTDRATARAAAQTAWRVGGDQSDMLRHIVSIDPVAYLAAARLEGLLEDLNERKSMLHILVDAGGLSIHRSRLAHLEAELGNPKEAITLLLGVLGDTPDSILDREKLAELLRETGDFDGLVDTLETLAEAMTVKEHKIQYLQAAVDVALCELLDPYRTARLCIDILRLDPTHADACTMGNEVLFETRESRPRAKEDWADLQIEFVSQRIRGTEDKKQLRELHIQAATLRLAQNDPENRNQGKKHLDDVLEIIDDDVETHVWLAKIHREDGEWQESIDHYIAASKTARGNAEDIKNFYAMGEIYADHLDRADMAKKAFLRVIKWDKTHQSAVERVAKIYARVGDFERAAKALTHLVGLSTDKDTRIERMIELAKIHHERLENPAQAKRWLLEAARINPFAFEPIEALAKLLKKEQAPVALKVHFDGTISSLAGALERDPDSLPVYEVLAKVLALKGDASLEGFAQELIRVVGGAKGKEAVRPVTEAFEVKAALADPEYVPFFCPGSVTAALLDVMKTSEEYVASALNLGPGSFGANKRARLDRKNRVNRIIQDMSGLFGMTAPQGYVVKSGPLRAFPGTPASILFPEEILAAGDETAIRFAVGYGLQMIRLGLSLATSLEEEQLLGALAAIFGRVDPASVPNGFAFALGREETEKIIETMPESAFDRINPLKGAFAEAVAESLSLGQIESVGHRFGLMCAGSIAGAINGIKMVTGKHRSKLGEIGGAGPLIGFLFSRTHVELRNRLGL